MSMMKLNSPGQPSKNCFKKDERIHKETISEEEIRKDIIAKNITRSEIYDQHFWETADGGDVVYDGGAGE